MSLNTNGFITKYIKATQKLLSLKNDFDSLTKELEPIYSEVNALRAKYKLPEKELQQSKLSSEMRDWAKYKEYYYFRCIIDGIYNLLKEYGWQYQYELFSHLRNFGIKCSFDEGFDMCYTEDICELTPSTAFSHEYYDTSEEYLIWSEFDTYDEIKMPLNLDIESILLEARAFLKDSVELYNKKEKDKEYETYLRLKEKYEGATNNE